MDSSRTARDVDPLGATERGSSGPSKSDDILREETRTGFDHASSPEDVSVPAGCLRRARDRASRERVTPCETPLEGYHLLRLLRRISLHWKGHPSTSGSPSDRGLSQLQPRPTAGRVLLLQAAAPPKLENSWRLAAATGSGTTLGRFPSDSRRFRSISFLPAVHLFSRAGWHR